MKLIRNPKQIQRCSLNLRSKGKRIGFVPTMGYLHEGHLSLIRRSVKECDLTVVSIYVNPLQFGPREDFKRYPRNLKRDMMLAAAAGADYVFAPRDIDMYPGEFLTAVCVDKIGKILCGSSRPGHFTGVTTVVTKLFNIVLPDIAYFGQKDAQQAVIIRKMAKDLNMPVTIKVLPTAREPDGLALSSRNAYLNPSQRQDALVIYKSLRKARQLIRQGERNPHTIVISIKRLIQRVDSARIDYINIVDAADLSRIEKIKGNILIALAVFIGKFRLIDNIMLRV